MQPSIFLQKPFWKEWTEGRQVLFWLKLTLFFLLFLFWTSNEAAAQCGPYITLSPNNPNQSAANNSDVFLTIWFTDPSPANNTTVGTWSGWSQAGNGNSTSARFNPAVEGSGVYFVKYTISQPAGMCQLNEMAFDTIYVDGNNSSQIPGVTANYTSVCPGGTVQLTATPTDSTFSVPVFNYSISSSTSVGASVNASGLVTAGSTGQIVVAVTETSAYGVSQAASFIINVVNPPVATANVPVVTNCAGSVSSGILLSTSHIPSAQVEYVVTGVVSSFNINTLAPGTVVGSGNNAPFPTPTLINSNFNGNVTY
ncbi:MAG TPA: hypothetical protein PKC40_03255, partial [Saprospiraceae bacterium]|nr:hypothetical protein [Saprospiraceae bacterium]